MTMKIHNIIHHRLEIYYDIVFHKLSPITLLCIPGKWYTVSVYYIADKLMKIRCRIEFRPGQCMFITKKERVEI